MFRDLLKRWSDWTGDKRLTEAIRAELRRKGYAVHAAQIREVRLAAIERPGWVQIYRFAVETTNNHPEKPQEKESIVLLGLSRDDGRKSRIEILLTPDKAVWEARLAAWSDGLIVRR